MLLSTRMPRAVCYSKTGARTLQYPCGYTGARLRKAPLLNLMSGVRLGRSSTNLTPIYLYAFLTHQLCEITVIRMHTESFKCNGTCLCPRETGPTPYLQKHHHLAGIVSSKTF
jgi:hypothetical protein